MFSPVLLGVMISLLVTQGCVTTRRSQPRPYGESTAQEAQVSPPQLPVSPEVFVPSPLPSETQQTSESYGPQPVITRPLVLVLGPGLAKGFAAAGVIQALVEAKIPIGAVLGTEMGSLIAALYAFHPNVNQFEWSLQKVKEDLFEQQTTLLGRHKGGPSKGESFESKLKELFRGKDLKNSKIPIRIAFQNKQTGVVQVVDQGDAVKAIRAAMASPKLFTSSGWTGADGVQTSMISDRNRPFLVDEAKQLNLGPVVVVDVLPDSEVGAGVSDLAKADFVLHPEVSEVKSSDFKKKTEAVYQGKAVVASHLGELKRLAGIPVQD